MGSPAWFDMGAPTLDRPFGLHLWPIFEKTSKLATGYSAEEFQFVPGVTPFSTLNACSAMLLAYYLSIFSGQEMMRTRKPFQLTSFLKLHNFLLSGISGVLLALFAEQMIPTIARHGLFHAICRYEGGWSDKLAVLYYLNYMTKFLELLDTVLLVLRKKPLTFLHTYHHGATALLCYTQLIGRTPLAWLVISLNLAVHVVMYWYYFQSARGVGVWWKKYITAGQITQFVIDLSVIYFGLWTYYTSTYWPSLPNVGSCDGEQFPALFGTCIMTSYLFLFVGFYFATYRKPVAEGGARGDTSMPANGVKTEKKSARTVGRTRRRLSTPDTSSLHMSYRARTYLRTT